MTVSPFVQAKCFIPAGIAKKAPGWYGPAGGLVELFAHADLQCSRNHSDVLYLRMCVRRDLVSCREQKPHGVEAFLGGIAFQPRDFRSGRNRERTILPNDVRR